MSDRTNQLPNKVILATRNRHKVEELRALLSPFGIEVVSALDFPHIPDVVEDGQTFEENATKKAVEIASKTGIHALADDSGLSVDALEGAPGIYSARYAGEPANDAANNEKLLLNLAHVPEEKRSAHFVSVLAYASPGGDVHTFRGVCEGKILYAGRGNNGFGYDPLFFLPEHGRTMAEIDPVEKNRISHRARAYQKFIAWIEQASVSAKG